MRLLLVLVLLGLAGLLVYAEGSLPARGSPSAPASTHVSPQYIEGAVEDVGVPNVVTAVLADYRGYDTLGETLVVVTAGMAIVLVLADRRGT